MPLLSVVIPTLNGEAYLAEALESLIEQDLNSLEVLIQDGGSTDGTRAIIDSLADKRSRSSANPIAASRMP